MIKGVGTMHGRRPWPGVCGTLALLVSLLVAACGGPGASGGTLPIKIGAEFALTGDEAALDLPAAYGAPLAAREINAAGGVLGRPLELVVRDSEFDFPLTARLAQELVTQEQVAAVIGFTDPDSVLAAAPPIQAAGRPFITPGATSPRLPAQVG